MGSISEKRLYSMENSRLREIYKTIKTTKTRLSKFPVFLGVPAVFFFFFLGWQFLLSFHSKGVELFFDCSITGGLEFLVFGICGIMLTSDENKIIVAIPFVFAVLIGVKYLLFRTYSLITAFMLLYLIIACVMIYKDNKTAAVMKGMDIFPFNARSDGRKPKPKDNIDYDSILKQFN